MWRLAFRCLPARQRTVGLPEPASPVYLHVPARHRARTSSCAFSLNKLSKQTGKSFIVENRAGAFGNIATEYVVRAKPDGHTVCIAPGSSVLAAAPHLFNKLNYDPLNDLEHITTLFKMAVMLTVAADSPFKTVAELTAHLQKQGDKAKVATAQSPTPCWSPAKSTSRRSDRRPSR